MGRKRESWNNYARLFELLVMQEEVYPTSDGSVRTGFHAAGWQIWSMSGNFRVPLVIAFRLLFLQNGLINQPPLCTEGVDLKVVIRGNWYRMW